MKNTNLGWDIMWATVILPYKIYTSNQSKTRLTFNRHIEVMNIFEMNLKIYRKVWTIKSFKSKITNNSMQEQYETKHETPPDLNNVISL